MAGSGASDDEIVLEIEHCIRIFKSGLVERYFGSDPVPPSTDADTGVASKDHTISPDVAVRLYLPPVATESGEEKKIPILVYFHGGGFVLHTAFNFVFHAYLTSLAARARAIIVSVDYRLAPEHPLPAAYDDSWEALAWVASHAPGGAGGDEPWLTDHGDFSRLSLGGESAGGNIAHNLAMRAGAEGLPHGARISGGIVLVHPYFLGHGKVPSEESDPVMAENVVKMWRAVCPQTTGVDDPWINPLAAGAPSIEALACGRVLVCLAETDVCRDRGRAYCEGLRASGWAGEVEVLEVAGQAHCFHLGNFACDDAVRQDDAIARFLNL